MIQIYSDTNINSLYDVANRQLSEVCEWLQANRLSVNSKKCNFIIFSKKDKIPGIDELKIKINNTEIGRVDKTKFLGVLIDSRLSWKPHIHEVENKIAKNIGIIHRLHFLFPRNILRNLYCSLVLPYLSVLHSCLGHYFCVY